MLYFNIVNQFIYVIYMYAANNLIDSITNLSLSEAERDSDLVAAQAREVVGARELLLQAADLRLGERRALLAAAAGRADF